eukprot:TRINITY_DN45500_c0_g1_i1.p2 TRINITY_DN45500_c0_g1~~TRINITY_DN45500_c0_g1_i1.p2  ORF type:complete len:312 (+),score=116.16 TRINITY_DN45500_c0_g1_i1:257-1192(+)
MSAVKLVPPQPHESLQSQRQQSNMSLSNVVARFLCSSSAACIAEGMTFPIDTTRVRVQMTGKKVGMLTTATEMARLQGIGSFYSGIGPAMVRQFVQCGVNLGSYVPIRDALGADKDDSILKKGLAGAISGSLGQFIAIPTDIVKVRMQADNKTILLGGDPKYRGAFHCLRECYGEAGFLGMWRGATPSCIRSAVIHSSGLASYDASKAFMTKRVGLDSELTSTHIICSSISGITTSIFGCPFDVIKTRVMNHEHFATTTPRQILMETIRREGPGALFKGYIPTLSRIGPWQVIWLTAYEKFCIMATGQSKI